MEIGMRRRWLIVGTLVGLAAVLVAAALAVEAAVVTCGERFPSGGAGLASGRPPDAVRFDGNLPFLTREARERELAEARHVTPAIGLGPLDWALSTNHDAGAVVAGGDTVTITAGAGVGSFTMANGTLRWQRDLPGPRAGLSAFGARSVVTAGPRRESGSDEPTYFGVLSEDGQPVACGDFGDGSGQDDRFGVATDAARGLVAVVDGGGTKTRVVLYNQDGSHERWSRELDGDWGRVAIAGGSVVVGDGPQGAVGLSLDTGDARWTLAGSRLGPAAPTLGRLRTASGRVVGVTAPGPRAEGDATGPGSGVDRFVGVDPETGRVLWRSREAVSLGENDAISVLDDLVVAGPAGAPVLALDPRTGATRWRARGGPGKNLGSFAGGDGLWIYGTGGRPTAFARDDGHPTPIFNGPDPRFFGLDGAAGAGHLAFMSQTGLLLVYPLT
jgi:PQQ-like domain